MTDEDEYENPITAAVTYRDALREIALMQQEALDVIKRNGFVFDEIGAEPGNWQHLAFSLYTTICEIDTLARNALGTD